MDYSVGFAYDFIAFDFCCGLPGIVGVGLQPLIATAAIGFANALVEEIAEKRASQLPILLVDAIFHLRGFDLSLYETCVLEFLKVLRHSGFCNRKLFVNIAEIAFGLLGEKLQNSDAGWVSHRLGKACQLLGLYIAVKLLHSRRN